MKLNEKDRIQCGKCGSEFHPMANEKKEPVYKCPMCGFGKCDESLNKNDRKILLDSKIYV